MTLMDNTKRRSFALSWLPLFGTGAWLNAQNKKENRVDTKREVRLQNPAALSKPNGYSHVAEIVSGRMVYIAGQVSLDQSGQIVGKDDFAAQVRQVFANLNAALKSAGA